MLVDDLELTALLYRHNWKSITSTALYSTKGVGDERPLIHTNYLDILQLLKKIKSFLILVLISEVPTST